MSTLPPLLRLDDMLRKNPDGSITVGIIDDFARDMNPPVIEDAPVKEEPKPEAVKKTVRKKPVKK